VDAMHMTSANGRARVTTLPLTRTNVAYELLDCDDANARPSGHC